MAGLSAPGLKNIITSEGVWRIRREQSSPVIQIFKYESSGYADILSPEFIEWRNQVPNTKDSAITSPDGKDGKNSKPINPDAKDSSPVNIDSDIKSDTVTT